MAGQLNLDQVTVQFDVTPILNEVSAGVEDGDRIGVVGLNGAGKSTLLDIIARRRTPDSGRVSWRSGLHVAFVGQSDDFADEKTIRELVVPGTEGAEHEWAADPRARRVLEGLGLLRLGLERTVGELSGGERRRVGLAAALVSDVDLLILDEPTNHLDIEGVQWLASYLDTFAGSVLVVTHDRWFLDAVCNRTWEVADATIRMYVGGYADWVYARAERQRISDVTEERRRNLARKELAWLRRGAPARTSKPRFRIEAANAIIADVPPPRDKVELVATATSRMGKTVVDLVDATVEFDGRRIIDRITWRLSPGGRYGLLGPNGAGKSTLLRTLIGSQELSGGSREIGSTVRIGHLSQSLAELRGELRMIEAVSEHASLIRIGDKDLTGGQLLERFGFPASSHKRFVRDLSGGQRRRLQLVRTLMHEPNFLILDEPTNDLDVDTLTALEDLLDGWPGTLVVVSHDRYLLERVCDVHYAVLGDGALRNLPGGVDQYLELRRKAGAGPVAAPADPGQADGSQADRSPADRRQADRTQAGTDRGAAQGVAAAAPAGVSAAERRDARKALGRVERQITQLSATEQQLHDDLAANASDFEKVRELNATLREVEERKAALEEEWLELAETAE